MNVRFCSCGCGIALSKRAKLWAKGHHRRIKLDSEKIRSMYLVDKLSSYAIGSELGVGHMTIIRELRKQNILRPESGVNSRNRNFYTKQYRSGYPVTFLPEHPRANNLGYVFDHILTIEKRTGKTPSLKEPIHHKDLDRTNSEDANLYLSRSHSDHQRAHNSLLKVASQLFKQGVIEFKDGEYYIT